MRYDIIIVLLVVISICSYWIDSWRNRKLQKGVRFCEKVENLLKAYQEAFGVKIGNVIYKYNAKREYYRVVYDSKNPRSFYMQLELGIADALDEYDKIKNNEYDYVEEDWECILEHHESLQELSRTIRYEAWLKGFRKI